MSLPFGTTIASPVPPYVAPWTTWNSPCAAAAKSGGVLPTPPTWIEPELMASSSGGPEVNSCHWIS